MTARQQTALGYFIAGGFADTGSAAVVGAISGESGVNLDSTVFRVHADHDSGGIAEWRLDRKTAMIAFCQARGKLSDDLEAQCQFLMHELETDPQYVILCQELKDGKKSIETMCWNFVKIYERPNMALAHMDDIRVPQAKAVYNRYKATKSANGAVIAGAGSAMGSIVSYLQHGPGIWSLLLIVAACLLWALFLAATRPQKAATQPSKSALPLTPAEEMKEALAQLAAAQARVLAAELGLTAQVKEFQDLLDKVHLKPTAPIAQLGA